MSRAFVFEDAAAEEAARLPERPVGPGPNLVTPRGRALIAAEVARLSAALAGADEAGRAFLARDLRYWRAREASAQVVEAPPAPAEVAFGTRVILRGAGAPVTWHIVGQDEADPAAGRLSWVSPLAQALLGAAVGEEVETPRGPVVVERIERA